MDVLTIAIPDTQVWVVFVAWIGCYVAGRMIAGGLR